MILCVTAHFNDHMVAVCLDDCRLGNPQIPPDLSVQVEDMDFNVHKVTNSPSNSSSTFFNVFLLIQLQSSVSLLLLLVPVDIEVRICKAVGFSAVEQLPIQLEARRFPRRTRHFQDHSQILLRPPCGYDSSNHRSPEMRIGVSGDD